MILTARMQLRRFGPDDGHNLFALDDDPAVMRYLTGGPGTPRAVIDSEMLPRFIDAGREEPPLGFWAAESRVTRAFLGWFSLRRADAKTQAVLGYRLRRAVWGQGYATEGAEALIRLGFTQAGLERITASAYEENLASRRVMEKAGLRFTRRFRLTSADLAAADTSFQEGDVWEGDDVEYAITRAEWERRAT
ncbi:MAG: GNAT family N-acetyltransferase [Caldilineaceae bacterium]|nr:GNAT family N-acetyltransferase [Caldilineaceae bacterium]